MYGKSKSKKRNVKKGGTRAKKTGYSKRTGGVTPFTGNTKYKKFPEIGRVHSAVQRGIDILPQKWFVRFKYAETEAITANAAGRVSSIGYAYCTNNSYDPRYSLGGKQCLYYDEIAPYYERVWDWACLVEVEFSNPSEDGMWCGVRARTSLDTTPTTGQNIDYLQQMPNTFMEPINNTGSQVKRFKFCIKNYKLFGVTKDQYHNLEYSHQNVGAPGVYALVEPFAFSTVSEGATIRYNIKLTYYSELTNRITVSESA